MNDTFDGFWHWKVLKSYIHIIHQTFQVPKMEDLPI